MSLDKERVLDVQEIIKPNYTVPLDYPFTPEMSLSLMKKDGKILKIISIIGLNHPILIWCQLCMLGIPIL